MRRVAAVHDEESAFAAVSRLLGELADLVPELPLEQIPKVIGSFAETRVLLEGRYLRQPAPAQAEDRLLTVGEVAARLGSSTAYVYRNAHRWSFTVHQGRMLRFSSTGIDLYLRGRQGRT